MHAGAADDPDGRDGRSGYNSLDIQSEIVGESVETARRRRAVTLGALAALTLIGAILRLWNLGALPFIVDEGFHALAVEGLLQRGVPKLDHGQLYWRAPLFTYFQGASALLLGHSEFALRLPAAVFGTLAIPLAYFLGRDLVDRRTGLVLAALIALSQWEIEFSRYARFYTLFQLLFMFGVWSFYWGFFRDRVWARVVFVVATLLAVSIHDLGVMLGTLFLLVLPMRAFSTRRKVVYSLLPFATILAWRLVGMGLKEISELFEAPSRTRPVGGLESVTGPVASVSKALGQPLKLPDFGYLLHAWEHHPWWFALIALGAGLTLGGMLRWVRKARRRPPIDPAVADQWAATDRLTQALRGSGLGAAPQAKLMMGLAASVMGIRRPQPPITTVGAVGRMLLGGGMIVAAALHQGALALLLGLLYLACFVRSWRGLLERPFLAGAIGAFNLLVAWCLYLMVTDLWGWRDAPWRLTTYPDLHFYFLKWMRAGWPVVLLGGVIGCLLLIRRARDEERGTPEALGAWVVLGGLLLPLFAMGLMDWRWGEARYTFHVYPLLLIAYALPFVALAQLAPRRERGLAVAAVLAVLLSLDAAPWNSVRPALRDHTSRRSPTHAVINRLPYATFHQDHRTPSRYVRERLSPEDRVVVVGMPHQAAIYRYYVGQADVVVGPRNTYVWLIDAKDRGWVDPITFARVVYEWDDLLATLEAWRLEGRRVWVLGDRLLWAERTFFLPEPLEQGLPQLIGEPMVVGLDGVTFAARWEPTEPAVER